MKSIIMTFEVYVDNIVKNLKMALPKVSDSLNIKSFKSAIFFYEIIDNQVKKSNIFVTTRDDLINKSLISSNGVEYRQATAPLFNQYHHNTFDT